jgi:1,4-dihydroxy-2-naphthoyl-CoA hydrolase
MIKYEHTIKLHETDAAGILFFTNQLKFIHDAYEVFLKQIGFGFDKLVLRENFFIPIVHVEADYKKAIHVGDELVIHLTIDNIGTTSFTLDYQIYRDKAELVGAVQTVHVTTDKKGDRKVPIPPDFLKALKEFS